jgi:hypothetical protein
MSWKALAITAALMFGTAGIALAGQTTTQSKTATTTNTASTTVHHEMGTVASMTNSDLVLSHEYKGKAESTKFMLDPSTKKEGAIDKGARVEVYYKTENHQHVATEIKAEAKKS